MFQGTDSRSFRDRMFSTKKRMVDTRMTALLSKGPSAGIKDRRLKMPTVARTMTTVVISLAVIGPSFE